MRRNEGLKNTKAYFSNCDLGSDGEKKQQTCCSLLLIPVLTRAEKCQNGRSSSAPWSSAGSSTPWNPDGPEGLIPCDEL